MQAVIMAGGQGVRLRPMTCDTPKPMVPLLGKPLLEYGIGLLAKHGITRMAVTTQYLPGRIMDYFGNGSRQGVELRYHVENKPLGTAGSVRNAMGSIGETFVVLSGDALLDVDIGKAFSYHRKKSAKLTIVLKKSPDPVRFGVVIVDRGGRVVRFQEKPSWDEVFSDLVNTGIYIMEPEIMGDVPEDAEYDFSKDLFPRLLAAGCPMYGYVTGEYWCDVGSPEQYCLAHEDFLLGRIRLDIAASQIQPGVYVCGHPLIHSSAALLAPCYVGEDAAIGERAVIGPGAVVGRGSRIETGASVRRSILWDNVAIGPRCEIRGAVLCDGVKVGGESRIFEGVTIGARTAVGEDVRIHGGVRIWPEKAIESHDDVGQDIVWNQCREKQVLRDGRLEGWVSRDITPEYIAQVSCAFASLRKPGSRIGLCGWGSKASGAVLDGMKAALSLTGYHCDVMEDAPPYMLRYAVRAGGLSGGIHIASRKGKWRMSFYDAYGCPLGRSDARAMENALRHVAAQPVRDASIGDVVPLRIPPGQYTRGTAKQAGSAISALDVLCEDEELGQYFAGQLQKIGYDVCFIKGDRFPDRSGRVSVKIAGYGDTLILRDEARRVLTERQMSALLALLAARYLPAQRDGGVPLSPIFPRDLSASIRNDRSAARETGYLASDWVRAVAEGLGDRAAVTLLEGPMAIVALDWMLTEEATSLHRFVDRMPAGAIRERRVHCPWEHRGNIMRALIREADSEQAGTGGVKISREKSWVFIAPDPGAPVFHIYAEGFSEEYAESMIDLYSGKISRLIEGGPDR